MLSPSILRWGTDWVTFCHDGGMSKACYDGTMVFWFGFSLFFFERFSFLFSQTVSASWGIRGLYVQVDRFL